MSASHLEHNSTSMTQIPTATTCLWVPVPESPPEAETPWSLPDVHLLLPLLSTFCLSLPKLLLAWRIVKTTNQVELFNQAVALSLATSGDTIVSNHCDYPTTVHLTHLTRIQTNGHGDSMTMSGLRC